MADATVAVDGLEALQIAGNLAAEVALEHPLVLGDEVEDLVELLFGEVLRRTGPVPVLLERDHEVPPLAVLLEEVSALKAVIASALGAEEGTGGREVGEPPGERRHVEVGAPGLSKRVPERGAREEG